MLVSSPASTLIAPWLAIRSTPCVPLMPEPTTLMSPVLLFTTTLLPDTTVAVCVLCACVPFDVLLLALYGEGLVPPLLAEPLTQRPRSPRPGDASEIPMLELLDCMLCSN